MLSIIDIIDLLRQVNKFSDGKLKCALSWFVV